MLDNNLKDQLKTYLANLKRPVELVLATDDSEKSQQLLALARDIEELSDLVSYRLTTEPQRVPSMQVSSPDTGTSMAFAGLPMGHEFTSLVLALLHSGGHPIKQEQSILEQIKALPGPLHFETYV
ncbi:alkyl hydroperoxide reductase subunit F, partial [Bowmanella dokdonensis]|nr:alkyl hydroperoxide reductase subunit F [Bowmanella dokdonensis]